jgi:phenylpropionate dioxygenase-like ring-hydroxylating dioxygenase large terminal subunit
MDRNLEIELVARVLDQQARRTTTMAEAPLRIPAERYVSEEFFDREQRAVFRSGPVFACMSVDIAETGDSFTFESGGVPIVVVRAADGAPRAYVNVCRHRAARLVRDDARGARSFACPFHGWVYDIDDGRLLGQPRSCDGFSGVDPACLGLRRLAASEAHGIVVVHPGSADDFDLDDWLAGLGPELETLGYATLAPYRRERTAWDCNWKLLLDTFLESYHVFSLHKVSLAPFYLGIASPFDAFGPHNRIVVPQSSILDQAGRPRDEWELLPYAVLQYFMAPNVIFSNLYGYVMTWRFIPQSAGRTMVEHALYTYREASSDEDRAHFDQRFDAARRVTGDEDFPESEAIQRNLASGMVDTTIAGCNEPGIVHFHELVASSVASVS